MQDCVQVASCLVHEGSDSENCQALDVTSLPQEVVSIAVQCLGAAVTALSDSGWQVNCLSTGSDATELACTAYSQLRRITRIRAHLIHCSAAEAASFELLEAHLQPRSFLRVAELYWWAIDKEQEHRCFLHALVKTPLDCTALQVAFDGTELTRMLQDLIRCVQSASESQKAAAAACFSSWFEEWASDSSKVQLPPPLLKAALSWLHGMSCQQWQVNGDGSHLASAFSKVKAAYLKHLLDDKQYEAVLQFLQCCASDFSELSNTTAYSDLSVQLSCILHVNQDGGWHQLQNVLSRSSVSKHDQIHLVLALVVQHVNDQTSGKQANVCASSNRSVKQEVFRLSSWIPSYARSDTGFRLHC